MNILPKKRWHVRTKENIARVRKDEAEFEEKQLQDEFRSLIADQEARTEALRKRALTSSASPRAHAIQSHSSVLSERSTSLMQGNKEYEEEKKAEKEAAEKSIGLLTYLGQSVVEAGGERPWYDMHPKKLRQKHEEKIKIKAELEANKKIKADPLTTMNKVSEWFEKKREEKAKEEAKMLQRANACIAAIPSLFPNDISVPSNSRGESLKLLAREAASIRSIEKEKSKKHKHKHKRKHHSKRRRHHRSPSDSVGKADEPTDRSDPVPECASSAVELAKQLTLDRLRAERLQRERKERERAALVMAKAMGLTHVLNDPAQPELPTDEREIPFNSAFNPELSAALAIRRQQHRESRKRRYQAD